MDFGILPVFFPSGEMVFTAAYGLFFLMISIIGCVLPGSARRVSPSPFFYSTLFL
jgi:hypothetical protein